MVTRLLQALDTLAYSGMFIARFALVALLVLSLYAVVSRYVFNSASVHALEFSTYLLSMIAWLSLAWILREDRHVRMDALRDNLPTWLKRIANTISLTAIVIFSTVLVWAGAMSVQTAIERGYRTSSLLAFPLWIVYLLVPIGAGLLALMALRIMFKPVLSDNEEPS